MAKLPYEAAESIVDIIPRATATSGASYSNDNSYFDFGNFEGNFFN